MFAETPSSRPPQLPFKDSPFSIHGRFNRMSYLGGYGLIYLVTLIGFHFGFISWKFSAFK